MRLNTFTHLARAALAFTALFFVPVTPSFAAETVSVVEFYNRDLDSYFISGRRDEQQMLDGIAAFSRTGAAFVANPASEPATAQIRVCRFYISLAAPYTSTHFYGREGIDCNALIASPPAGFSYEGYDFAVAQPDATAQCPANARFPVWRAFRAGNQNGNGKTANHRYLTSNDRYQQMVASGWTGEGIAFCATAIRDVADDALRASLVRNAAERDPHCTAIAPFYYEIGDARGALVSGSIGALFNANSVMPIASASKWLYGAYVTQMHAGVLSSDDARFLTFRSGYVSFSSCAQGDTVASCALSGGNDRLSPLAIDHFYYGGGHMQMHAAQVMGLGALGNEGLAAEISRGLGLDTSNATFRYSQPQLAGGVTTSPAVYASFLRRLLDDQLAQSSQLNASATCTNPLTCATAIYSPFPSSESPNYSIGHWVEDTLVSDGAYSSAGAFGFYPWIDATKSLYGLIGRADAQPGSGGDSVPCGRVLRHTWATGKAL